MNYSETDWIFVTPYLKEPCNKPLKSVQNFEISDFSIDFTQLTKFKFCRNSSSSSAQISSCSHSSTFHSHSSPRMNSGCTPRSDTLLQHCMLISRSSMFFVPVNCWKLNLAENCIPEKLSSNFWDLVFIFEVIGESGHLDFSKYLHFGWSADQNLRSDENTDEHVLEAVIVVKLALALREPRSEQLVSVLRCDFSECKLSG